MYQIYHLDGSRSAVIALVACFGPGTFNGLLNVFSGQHAEHNRDFGGKGGLGNALGDLAAHIVIVAGAATDYGAQAYDGVIPSAGSHAGGDERYLKGARNPGHGDIVLRHLMAPQAVQGAGQKPGGNEFVETGGDNAYPYFLGTSFPSNIYMADSPILDRWQFLNNEVSQ